MACPPGEVDYDHIDHRREAMRRELLGELAAHHRRKRAGHRLRSALILVIVSGLLMVLAAPLLTPHMRRIARDVAPRPAGITDTPEPAKPQRPAMHFAIVTTQPSVTARHVVKPPAIVDRIDDAELLMNLAALSRPTGLIRSGGRTWLTSPVTDPLRDRE